MDKDEIEPILNLRKNHYINVIEKHNHHYDVFLDDDIGTPDEYRELMSILFNAGEDDTVNIFINSNGGNLDSAMAIVEGLKVTSANVIGIIIGACHSAASIISMYCSEIIVMDNAYSMVHTATSGSYGTVGNSANQAAFIHNMVNKLLVDTYDGFLTKDELKNVMNGQELWFNAEEIRTRMKNRIEYLTKKHKKMKNNS